MYVRGFKTQNERLDDDVRTGTTISDITIFQNCLVLIFGAKFIEQKLKKFENVEKTKRSFSQYRILESIHKYHTSLI